jgi:hypothetical protein
MQDKTKKRIYFWLFIVFLILTVLFAITISETQDELTSAQNQISDMNNKYCANFSNTTDIKDIRSLAENFIISKVKDAYNIKFDNIYLVGNRCSQKWWITARYDKKIDDNNSVRGASFLIIDPVNKNLEQFITFTCFGKQEYYTENSCNYNWQLSNILGENKQEASSSMDLLR